MNRLLFFKTVLALIIAINFIFLRFSKILAEELSEFDNNQDSSMAPILELLPDFDNSTLSVKISAPVNSSLNIYLDCTLIGSYTITSNPQTELIVEPWIAGKKYNIMADLLFEDSSFSNCSNIIDFIAPDENSEQCNPNTEIDNPEDSDIPNLEQSSNDKTNDDTLTPIDQDHIINNGEKSDSVNFPAFIPTHTTINPQSEDFFTRFTTTPKSSSNSNLQPSINNLYPSSIPNIKPQSIVTNPYIKVLGLHTQSFQTQKTTSSNNNICRIKVHKDLKIIEQDLCKISPPTIDSAKIQKSGSLHKVVASGNISDDPKLLIEYYKCKTKSLWDPRTWFKCIDTKYQEKTIALDFNNKLYSESLGFQNYYDYYDYSISGNQYTLNKTYLNHTPQKISIRNSKLGSIYLLNRWIDIKIASAYTSSQISNTEYSIYQTESRIKPFILPITLPTGVTQWYGYTAFQNPHTGIDFGIAEKPIYAPADGIITSAQWDNYYGDCLSGGYFLKIKHTNGYHSVYLHLKNYLKSNGNPWQVGELIHKGELIGISGNSGAFNCQPLGYHLHYETRTTSSYTTHIDPVTVTETDWNQIPTLGWQYYPGRLSGNNPHPNY